MFNVRLNLGKEVFIQGPTAESKKLARPPGDNDSVKGHTGDSDVFIIYHNKKAYPEFLVEYKWN